MSVSKKQVEHLAVLSRLTLEENEIDLYTAELNGILQFVEKLQELNTEGVTPTSHAVHRVNVFRDDEVCASLTSKEALSDAPDQLNGLFKVPSVFEE